MTGRLWDTESGLGFGNEINLVEQGFNSGWMQVQGDWKLLFPPGAEDFIHGEEIFNLDSPGSSDFEGKGKYSSPEFTWKIPVGITAIKLGESWA